MGFIATPLTFGLLPNHLFDPAFPTDLKACSELETDPIVALQFESTFLTSPLRSLKVVYLPSTANIWAEEPALLAI